MKRVFTSHDPMLAGYIRAVLEEHGIGCIVKNEFLLGGAGELRRRSAGRSSGWSRTETRPAPCDSSRRPGPAEAAGEAWRCPACGEWIEPEFGACWRCAGDPPDAPTAGSA